MNKNNIARCAALALALTLGGAGAARAELNIAEAPLFLTSGAEPNIMFLIDTSGSMHNVVPEAPYNAQTIYLANCPAANLAPNSGTIELRIVDGGPRLRYGGTNYTWGTAGSTARCFDATANYMAKLYANNGTTPGNYLPAMYSGNYLNWYFNPNNTAPAWNAGQQIKPGVQTRMEVTREAASVLVGTLHNVRVGLAAYSTDTSSEASTYQPARVLATIDDVDNNRNTVTSAIGQLQAAGVTPLAESLHSLGRYFVQGHNQKLTMHPGWSTAAGDPYDASTHNAYDIFNVQPTYPAGVTASSPIQYFCQRNFVVIMTDGRPQADQALSTHPIAAYRDYDGDCLNATPACDTYDRKPDQSYESAGSDYLDDVAMALYDMDLRPDLLDFDGNLVKNNVATYMIGFAEEDVRNDPLMKDTANQGGGLFMHANNADELVTAFRDATQDIFAQISSASSVATNSTRLDTDTLIYQARFNSGDWSGQLLAFEIQPDGSVGNQRWDSGDLIPAAAQRKIATFRPSTGAGVWFEYANLDNAQKLHLTDGVADDALGADRVAYLRGDQSKELGQPGGVFRARNKLLGDIVNSNPFYVANPNFGYARLGGEIGEAYTDFLLQRANRRTMIYVGANDGMLHAFDAETGVEQFAFVPNSVYPRLADLTSPNYQHKYLVDGSPRVGDAYINGQWRSILVGSTGAGGRSVFALDVTDPDQFGPDKVLWEFTDPDLGYTIGQPTLARLSTGQWVAIFGNGYNSDNHRAILFMVNLADGTLFAKLNTGVGSATLPNGLSSPIPVDANGDQSAEAIYAGDLRGNLWKFTPSGPSSAWEVTRSGSPAQIRPLFTACSASPCTDDNRQPITSRPEVGRHPDGPGVMVYFGTGKYFEVDDGSVEDVQTFYGVWDNGSTFGITRTDLQQQRITHELSAFGYMLRVTTDHAVDWVGVPGQGNQVGIPPRRGWYLDLVPPSGVPEGERVIASPLLRHGRIIFVTMIPDTSHPCAFGGTGWLMELDAGTGGRLPYTPFDLNDDGLFNEDDYVEVTIDGETVKVPVSGKRSEGGIPGAPTVIEAGEQEYKYVSGSSGNIERTIERGADDRGRQSWRQL